MTIEDDIAFFQRVPTLSMLERDALRILAIGAESLYVHGGAVLFHTGEAADCAFVVQEGSFNLTAKSASEEPTVVGPGTLIGELALFSETRRPATATATEPSTVMRIPRNLFLKMLEGYPDAAVRMREALVARANETAREFAKVRAGLAGGLPRK